VQIFAARLTPGEVHDAAELPALVAQLRGEDAKAQLNAASQLKAFGIKASPALFKALADKPPLAVRSRIEEVLQAIGEFPIAPQTLQRTRAIQLLEQIGSEGAVGILKNLAAAKPPTAASLDAKAALERLEQRLRAPKIGLAPEG
jgi:HEAT repeat protein